VRQLHEHPFPTVETLPFHRKGHFFSLFNSHKLKQ
jgi:hypothetical protein